MKKTKRPELTALAYAALAAIRRDQEAAKAAETSEERRKAGEEAVALSK